MQNRPQLLSQSHPSEPEERSLLRTLFYASSLLTVLVVIIYLCSPIGKFLNVRAIDFLLNSGTTEQAQKETIIVAIDETSLNQFGQWPWPRYRLAMLLEKIQQGGPKTVAVNILFPEPDRTSPMHWKKTLHHELGYSIDTSTVPEILLDHDAYLANTLTNGNYVLGYEFLFQKPENFDQQCAPHALEISQQEETTSFNNLSLYEANSILCNNDTLLSSDTRSGFFNGTADRDGVLRRLPLLLDFKGKTYPSFAFEVLLQAKEIKNISILKGLLGTHYIFPGNIPIDSKGGFLTSNYVVTHDNDISAAEILTTGFDPAIFKNKVIFVGIKAAALSQEYRLPNGDNISMVDIHKLAYESLTASKHRTRGDFFWAIELLLSLLLTALLVLLIARLSTPWICAILLSVLSLLGISSMYLSWYWGLLFSPLLPWTCLFLNFFLLVTLKYKFFQKRSAADAGNALQLLESSQENLQSILNTIPDIVFRLDTNGKIIFISSAVTKYDSPQTPLLGRSIFDLVIPEDLNKAQFKLNERRTGVRATHDFEVRLRFSVTSPGQTNEVRYFSVSAAGLYKDGQNDSNTFIGTQGIVKDITQRKQIENQLLQAKKMEAMGNLAAGIAHDLNNILSGLVSYPDMILADLSESDPMYKKISLIKKSGTKAATIVQDLLTLARRNIHPQDICDLNSIISDYLESTEHNQALQKHQFITIQTQKSEPYINIMGSAVHISKVVMNLINNSMEAMPSGGNITISTSKIKTEQVVSGYEDIPPGQYGRISIEDNGMGIASADIPHVFEPFFTKKPTRNKGTGLGMTIIWATIKDHNGYIDISSTQSQGTTITLYLPTTNEQKHPTKKQAALAYYSGNETILVVDDMKEQLTIAGKMLHKLGYTTITAQNGTEALTILSKSSVDLVMLDMIMPGQMDGLETYEKILQFYPGQKAIISSGYSESDQVRRMQDMGAGSYIQKPYSMEELARAVRTELDNHNTL